MEMVSRVKTAVIRLGKDFAITPVPVFGRVFQKIGKKIHFSAVPGVVSSSPCLKGDRSLVPASGFEAEGAEGVGPARSRQGVGGE